MPIKTSPDKIVLSTNTNPGYIGYWEHVSKAWRLIYDAEPICAFVYQNDREYNEWYHKLSEHGTVIPLRAVDGVTCANQAKLARLYVAGKHCDPDDLVTLNDMDMLPLSGHWLKKQIEDKWTPNKLLCCGADRYIGTEAEGKFPMNMFTAESKSMQEIMNPNDLDFDDYIKQFVGMKQVDHKEDVTLPWHKFSDESVLRARIKQWNQLDRIVHANTTDGDKTGFYQLDKARMNQFDPSLLEAGKYTQFHCPRPFDYAKIASFVKYIEETYSHETTKDY